MRFTNLAKAFLLLALSVGYTEVCKSQKPVVQPEESKSGSITGRVTNESGQPLAGASVNVRPSGISAYTNRAVLTNSEGNFTVAGLDSGLYFVSASSPAYVTPPRAPDSEISFYRVGDNVQIQLIRGGVITGTVTDDSGEPVVSALIKAIMSKDASGKSSRGSPLGYRAGQTDDRGVYRIYGLQPGSYVVSAGGGGPNYTGNLTELDAPTYAPSATLDTASEFQVQPGVEITVDIRYRHQVGHSVSGIVKALGQNGVAVAMLQPDLGMLPMGATLQAPATQGFVFYGLADGTYTLTASESLTPPLPRSMPEMATSDPVQITVKGRDVKGVEVIMKPLAAVSGRIALEASKLPECQNKKQPLVAETTVGMLFSNKGFVPDQTPVIRSFIGSVNLEKDWSFSLKNLRAGQYAFSPNFFARYWYLKSIAFGGPAPTQIVRRTTVAAKDAAKSWTTIQSGERLNNLTITLAEGAGSIRGQVETTPDTKFDTRFRVYLVPSEREKVDDPLRYFATEVSSDGAFFITNLPPGKYLLVAQPAQTDVPLNSTGLHYPDAVEARARLRHAAEAAKSEVELKPCQNVTELQLKQN
jgi:hypothetical protein